MSVAGARAKSTALRSINGLEHPEEGVLKVLDVDVLDDETDMDALRAEVGMVFQHFNLFPHKTVLDTVRLAPQVVLGEDRTAQAIQLFDRVGVGDKREE